MSTLAEIVASNRDLFEGAVPESAVTLEHLERELRVTLPADLRWFWLESGSGNTGAAPSAAAAIQDTLAFRRAAGLPGQFLVLEERHDAGSVLLDTSSRAGRVIWIDEHAVEKVGAGTLLPSEHDAFETFAAWVEFCIEDVRA